MKHHEVEVKRSRHIPNPRLQAHCPCGWRSEWMMAADDLDEAVREHHRSVVEALTKSSNPSLASQAKQFRENSEDKRYTAEERRLWLQLAEEMEKRARPTIRDNTVGQDPLFP